MWAPEYMRIISPVDDGGSEVSDLHLHVTREAAEVSPDSRQGLPDILQLCVRMEPRIEIS